MRGFTRKRGSTWTAYWDGPTDPQTGKRRQKTKGGFEPQKHAQAFLNKTLDAIHERTYIEPSKATLGSYLTDEWFPRIPSRGKRAVRELTIDRYGQCVRRVTRDEIGAVPLYKLTAGHIDGFTRRLEDRGLSDATIRLTYATLRRALNDAVRKDKLAKNLLVGQTRPRCRARARSRGRTASYARFWNTSGRIASMPSGAWPRARACGEANCSVSVGR